MVDNIKKDINLPQKIDYATAKTINDAAHDIKMREGWAIYVMFASSNKVMERIQLFFDIKNKDKAKAQFEKLIGDWVDKEIMILEYPEGDTVEAIPCRAIVSITFAKSRGFFAKDAVEKVVIDNLIKNIKEATEQKFKKREAKKE